MIKELISSGKVVIFSKTTCPYCIKVKNFFKNEAKCDYVSYELNEMDNGAEIKEELVKLTNQTTVPSIFINSKHIGGCSDVLQAWKDGTLIL